MNIKRNLRKIAELGIGITAIATLALAGCGGGGSSSSSACSATGNVSGAEAVNCFFAETDTRWNADLINGVLNWAGTSSVAARSSTYSFVTTGANTYTDNVSYMDLTTSSSAWSTATTVSPSVYFLSASGWQPFDFLHPTYTNNGNGTITARLDPWYLAEATAITRTDLSGQPVVCTDPLGSDFVGENIGAASSPVIVAAADCSVAVTYPAGSASYTTTSTMTENELYIVVEYASPLTLTDDAGNALTDMPAIGTRFCLNGRVYDPIASPAAGADNYNVHYNIPTASSCTASDISSTLGNPTTWTAFVSWKDTGNTQVPQVFDIKTAYGGTTPHEYIYVFHLDKLMGGSYSPASTSTSTSTEINKAAASAQLRANGLPPLP